MTERRNLENGCESCEVVFFPTTFILPKGVLLFFFFLEALAGYVVIQSLVVREGAL